MKYNYFKEDLNFGNKGESVIDSKIYRLYSSIFVPFIKKCSKQYDFKTFPDKQREGKDIGICLNSDVEVKSRRYDCRFYTDILIEHKVGNKDGWFHKTKSPIVLYGVMNKKETDYLENKAWILFIDNCRQYFKDLSKYKSNPKWARTIYNGNEWWTLNYPIPLKDFPKNCLRPFPKDFWNEEMI